MKKFILGLFSICLFSNSLMASEVTPTIAPLGVKIISAMEVNKVIKEIRPIDARKAINFGKGHLPGAISVPVKWLDKKKSLLDREIKIDDSKIQLDKNSKIVVYSDGPTGWKSYHMSKYLLSKGFKNVFWMRDGFNSWKKSGYLLEK